MRFPKFALFIALLSPILLSTAYAQRGGGHGGGGGHAGGGGHVGGSVRGGYSGGGGFRGGYYGGRGYYGGHYYGGTGLYLGLGYPYYGYGAYYGSYPYPYPAYDPYYGDGGYAVQSAPAPQNDDYSYPSQPQAQPTPQSSANNNPGQENYYLIAFNNHAIEAATAYKVEGGQLHWINREGQEKQAPLSSVDIQFSRKINQDRNVDFQIP